MKHSPPVTWTFGRWYRWYWRPQRTRKDLGKAHQRTQWNHQSPQTCLRTADAGCWKSQDHETASSVWPRRAQVSLPGGCPWIHHHGPVAVRRPPVELFPLLNEGPFLVISGRAWLPEADGPGVVVDLAGGPRAEVICRGGSRVSPLVIRCCISSRVCWTDRRLYHFMCLQSPIGGAGYPK